MLLFGTYSEESDLNDKRFHAISYKEEPKALGVA